MIRTAMVQGASRGLGLAFVEELLARGWRVHATCRNPSDATELGALPVQVHPLDVTDESSMATAAEAMALSSPRLHLLLNVAGLLHDGPLQPEKRLAHIEPEALHRVFAVNAFGPLLVAKHFHRLLVHDEPAVLANLSARVGSIGDDRSGGWYAYRASKAAQNMFTKNLAIELGRRAPHLTVVALHPGTVSTDLSAPFRRNVPAHKLFDVNHAARQLLDVIATLGPADTGSFLAWDGSVIPW